MAQVDIENKKMKKEIESPWQVAWRQFKKNKLAMLGLGLLIIIALMAIFAPQLSPNDPYATNILKANRPPGGEFPLGTDRVGRCILSRIFYGARISITVGLVSMSISVFIGTTLGLMAGYFGGLVDTLISRLIDIVRSVPFLILAIVIASIWGPGLYKLMAIIGVLGWTGVARLVRGEVLALREREFIHASRASGADDSRIMFKHLLPNTFAPIIVNATLAVAYAILSEAGLSYLGLGIQPPMPSWGNMLNEARNLVILESRPWFWLPPGIMIIITVLSINFMGDGLRDALDPKLTR
ncbi:MAG: oligopeptide ABC transporter permease [Halanaerobiaceae bacterium]